MTDQEFLEDYFLVVAPIWREYQNRKGDGQYSMGMGKREELLAPHRTRLKELLRPMHISPTSLSRKQQELSPEQLRALIDAFEKACEEHGKA